MTWTINCNGRPDELLRGLQVAKEAVFSVLGTNKVSVSVTGWEGSISASASIIKEEQKQSA